MSAIQIITVCVLLQVNILYIEVGELMADVENNGINSTTKLSYEPDLIYCVIF